MEVVNLCVNGSIACNLFVSCLGSHLLAAFFATFFLCCVLDSLLVISSLLENLLALSSNHDCVAVLLNHADFNKSVNFVADVNILVLGKGFLKVVSSDAVGCSLLAGSQNEQLNIVKVLDDASLVEVVLDG